jgi:hypothetical protein
MIATIAPLVKVAPLQGLASVAIHVVSSVIGGALIGSVAGWMGSSLFGGAGSIILLVTAFAGALADLDLIGRGTPTLGGSVPRSWWERFGPLAGSGLYGLVLGTGVTTLVPVMAFYVVVVGAAIVGPTLGAAVGAVYGLARGLPVIIASAAVVAGASPLTVGDLGHRYRPFARTVTGTALLALVFVLLGR